MAIDELVLSGLAAGTKITAANTANFFDLGYPAGADRLVVAAVDDDTMGVRALPTGANNASKSFSTARQAQGRLAFKMKFTSNTTTTTTYAEMVALRFNTTNGFLVDVGMRHNTTTLKRFVAARNNFTYNLTPNSGQANTPANAYDLAAGAIWSFEVYWSGLAATVYVWSGEDTSGTPTFTWTGTMAQAPVNFLFGPDAGDGVDFILYDVWVSDGERKPGPPLPGTLNFVGNWDARETSLQVVGKVTGAAEVELRLDDVPYPGTIDSDGYFRVTATGIEANAEFEWDLFVDDVLRESDVIHTLAGPSSLVGSMRAILGSCYDSYGSPVFAKMAARFPDLYLMVGDRGYSWLSSSPNGPVSPTTAAAIRAIREEVFVAINTRRNMDYRIPEWHMYSDCDGAGANSDSTIGGHTNGSTNQVWRQMTANLELPIAGCGARSMVTGPVRWVMTDELAFASDKNAVDNSSKSKLGATQLAWFFDQIDQAVAAKQAVIWLGDGPVTQAKVTSGTTNEWSRYDTERRLIMAKIASSGVRIMRGNGDRHALGADDGRNNEWGLSWVNAAPIHTTSNPLGLTTEPGMNYPPAQVTGAQHYATIDAAWDNGTITVTTTGWSSSNAAPTEVQRFQMVLDLSYDVPHTTPYLVEWDEATQTMVEVSLVEWDGSTTTAVSLSEKV